ncbi:MAG: hypothetical protein GKR90_06930 [Pseudomonadales bacterium]|nr:hypothetical protein [Pseudomonadales bacterium]
MTKFARIVKSICVSLLVVAVSACGGGGGGGGGGSVSGATGATPASGPPVGQLRVEWQAPTENVDGSPVSGIANYRIYYGVRTGEYNDSVQVSGTATEHTLSLSEGRYYLVMTAIDVEGDESGYSNEVSLYAS